MKFVIIGVLSLFAWILLAFVAALPSGWVHVPLAVGVLLFTVAIVLGDGDSASSQRR